MIKNVILKFPPFRIEEHDSVYVHHMYRTERFKSAEETWSLVEFEGSKTLEQCFSSTGSLKFRHLRTIP